MASSSDDELPRRGRPRKGEDKLSVRSQRRRFDESFLSSLRAPLSPTPSTSNLLGYEDAPDPDNLLDGNPDDRFCSTFGTPGTHVELGQGEDFTCDPTSDSVESEPSLLAGGSFSFQSAIVEEDSEENNSWGTLFFDCDVCLHCQCIACDMCVHSETGNCLHCDACRFEGESEDGDTEDFIEFVEEVESSEALEDEAVLSEEDAESLAMRKKLTQIFLARKASHALINDILGFLHEYNLGKLPKSAKTLLKTPTEATRFRDVPPGQYWHCGITEHIVKFASKSNATVVDVTFSTDGVPIFNSSAKSFWPLTCSFNDSAEVFIIGVYVGNEKPADPNIFLKDFVEEIIPLCDKGIPLRGKTIPVNVVCAVCDAPAKCFILCIKYFNGYFSCCKCTTEGEMIGGRMTFPQQDAPLRSDEDFVEHTQQEFHNGRTILETIPRFGCVSRVPFDYMHLLLLGIMRKMMYLWMAGPLKVRLSSAQVNSISDRLVNLVGWVPCDFARKPRTLQYVKRFKATEFRLFLLYTGVVVLRDILPPAIYEHFLVFHVVTTIYVDPVLCKKLLNYGKELAKYFVATFSELYGNEYVSHNVHSFIHLGDDVEKFGNLDKFSAFKFENFYQILTKLMRKGERPLQQLVNRYSEMEACGFTPERFKSYDHVSRNSKQVKPSGIHCDGPMVNHCINPQYRSCTVQSGCTVKAAQADNCCILADKSIVFVENFATDKDGQVVLIGRALLKKENLYEFPCHSSLLGIFYAHTLSKLCAWPASQIKQKCFRIPWKSGFAVFPLHHREKV